MKARLTFLCLSIMVSTTTISVAQNNILAGKITGKNKEGVPEALVQLANATDTIRVVADMNGLYCTRPLHAGSYNITIISSGKTYNAGNVAISLAVGSKQYHNFSFTGDKAIATITQTDPFISTALAVIANSDPRQAILWGDNKIFVIHSDTASGEVQSIQSGAITMPKMK